MLSWRSDKKTEFRKTKKEKEFKFLKLKIKPVVERMQLNHRCRHKKKGLVASRLVGNETDALHLAGVVKSDDTDECAGVSFLALLKLFQHLGRVAAPKHRELPHHPVATVVVPWRFVVLTVNERLLHIHYTYMHNKQD